MKKADSEHKRFPKLREAELYLAIDHILLAIYI